MTKKIPLSTIVPFGLRLQPDLKARLESAATANSRSLNAEIAQRLEASLAEVPNAAEFEKTVDVLASLMQQKDQTISAQAHLISMCAMLIQLVNARIKPTGDYVSDRLSELTKAFSNCLMHGDLKAATKPVLEMIELGTQIGLLDDSGKLKPEFEYLKTDLPKRKKDPE